MERVLKTRIEVIVALTAVALLYLLNYLAGNIP